MTNDTVHSYTYDAANWLTKVDGGATATYTYLGALRVKKVAGATSTVYVYSGTKPVQEYENGTLRREYIYAGAGTMLATVTWNGGTATTTYQHPDHLSIRAESDSNGNLIRSTGRFPFGEAWYDTSPGSKWQFTTYERDTESNLDYADYRFYSSRLGRFVQADLLGGDIANPELLDRYSYALNDPINLRDPFGLCIWQFVEALGGLLRWCYSGGGDGHPAPLLNTGGEERGGGGGVDTKALAHCIFGQFGVGLLSFTASTTAASGTPTGNTDGSFTGVGSVDVYHPGDFPAFINVTNDTHTKSGTDLEREPASYTQPLAPGATVGNTSSDNPFTNYTAWDLVDPSLVSDTQIHELGNSLAFITGQITPGTSLASPSDDPGQKLENCYHTQLFISSLPF